MIARDFTTGGFVLHKIEGEHLSAWFDHEGNLCDIESFDVVGRSKRASQRQIKTAKAMGKAHHMRKSK